MVEENEIESVHTHGNNHAMFNINPRQTNGERNLSPDTVKTVKISREAIDQDEDDENDDMETGNVMKYDKLELNSDEELHAAGLCAKKSLVSSTGSNSASIRPILEGPNAILHHMLICLVALSLNILLLIFTAQFNSDFEVPIESSILHLYGGVTLEIVLLVTNIITIVSLDRAASVVFGSFLASKKGYSLTVCGFMGASPFQKFGFAQQLLLSSKSRKLLSRISLVWILAELLKVMTPFVAVAFDTKAHSSYSEFSNCMVFIQSNKSRPVDRGHPTFLVEQGVAEYAFGSSLGNMRSEMAVE